MKKSSQELLLSSVFTFLIYYTGISFLPLLFLILPLNFIILGVKNGFRDALISIGILLLASYLISGLEGMVILGLFALLALAIIYYVRKKKPSIKVISFGTLTMSVLCIGMLLLGQSLYEGDMYEDMENYVQSEVQKEIDLLEESVIPMDTRMDIGEVRKNAKDLVSYLMVSLPALIILESFIISSLNYYLAASVIRKTDPKVKMGYFRYFRLPDDFNRGVFYAILVAFILGALDYSYYDELLVNISIVVFGLFTIQGMSVIKDIVGQRSEGLAFFTNVLLLAMNLYFVQTFLGILEGIFHLRLMWRRRNG